MSPTKCACFISPGISLIPFLKFTAHCGDTNFIQMYQKSQTVGNPWCSNFYSVIISLYFAANISLERTQLGKMLPTSEISQTAAHVQIIVDQTQSFISQYSEWVDGL